MTYVDFEGPRESDFGIPHAPRYGEEADPFRALVCGLLETAQMRDRQAGFSLIELLVVVAIILIIAAIAVPNFLRAKISANESSAVSSVHAIDTAEISYSSMFSNIGYSVQLADLGTGGISPCPGIATASCFIDPALASGTKSGYNFTYQQNNAANPAVQFTINADPVMPDITGQKSFYSDESNIIRYQSPGPASINSAPI